MLPSIPSLPLAGPPDSPNKPRSGFLYKLGGLFGKGTVNLKKLTIADIGRGYQEATGRKLAVPNIKLKQIVQKVLSGRQQAAFPTTPTPPPMSYMRASFAPRGLPVWALPVAGAVLIGAFVLVRR